MKSINIKMKSTVDKSLFYPQGSFIMGIKYDNLTSRVIFEVPSAYKQTNAQVWLIPPTSSGQTGNVVLPLIATTGDDDTKGYFYFDVDATITQYAGEWTCVLMLLGSSDSDNPLCVSDEIIAIIKDTKIDPDNITELPECEALKTMLAQLQVLQAQLEETLLTADPSTVKEIEELLKKIDKEMESMSSIDWDEIKELATIVPTINGIQATCNAISAKIDNIKVDVDFTQVLNAIAEVKENTNTIINSFDNVDIRLTNIETTTNEISASVGNIDTNLNTANTNINNMSTNVDTINTNTTTMMNSIDTINANEKLDREDLTTLKTNDATIISLLTTANEVAESL